jgi:hypothetical protein
MLGPNNPATALILDSNDAAKRLALAADPSHFARLYRRFCAEFRGEVAERFPKFSAAELDALAARYGEAMRDAADAFRMANWRTFRA